MSFTESGDSPSNFSVGAELIPTVTDSKIVPYWQRFALLGILNHFVHNESLQLLNFSVCDGQMVRPVFRFEAVCNVFTIQ